MYKTVVCAGLRPKVRPSLDEHTTTECCSSRYFERPVIAKLINAGQFRWRRDLAQGGRPEAGSDSRWLPVARGAQTGQDLARNGRAADAAGDGQWPWDNEDANDPHSGMRSGAQVLVGRDPIDGEDLASQPTLSRFENAPDRQELLRI